MKKLLAQAGLGLASALFGLSAQATCLHVPKSGMPAIFRGTTCTATATNVIAATVPSITPQNTVQQIPMPPNVAPPPLSSLKNIGAPSGPAAGFLYAFAGDNLSQGTPTSPPPPPPMPSCACGGYPGTVYWSGWDSIGWETTPGGCYACPPPPPPSGLPADFCSSGCRLSLTGAICNSQQCYIGNGKIATIGTNNWIPIFRPNAPVVYASSETIEATINNFASQSDTTSCTNEQVTSGQCKGTTPALSQSQLQDLANNINAGNVTGAVSGLMETTRSAMTGIGTSIGGVAVGIGG